MDVVGDDSRRRSADDEGRDGEEAKRPRLDTPLEEGTQSINPPTTKKAYKSILRRKPPKRNIRVSFNERVTLCYIEKLSTMRRAETTDDDTVLQGSASTNEVDEEGREIIDRRDNQHTLDSDEEEEADHAVLNTNEVQGQEEQTIQFDGDTQIMPFNMDDDLEEGEFDTAGNFVRDRNRARELNDPWLNSVNWRNVEQNQRLHPPVANPQYDSDDSADSLDEEGMNLDYIELVKLLRHGETPASALKRIVAKRPSPQELRQQRFNARREGKEFVDLTAERINAINDYANRIQRNGYYNILNTTREDIQKVIEEHEARKAANRSLDDVTARLSLEMEEANKDDSEETYWEYHPVNGAEGNLLTDTTTNMIKMLESGQILGDTLCRRVGTENFYKAQRCEFDLFLEL